MYPQFDPSAWHSCIDHDPQSCLEAANCYSYILNEPHYYWAVPGLGFARSTPQKFFDSFNNHFRNHSVEDFRNALIKGAVNDGLIKVQELETREGYYLAALVFADDGSDFDFHWYRKDANGLWSHKNGWGVVTNKDDSNAEINDPREAASREFPVFGSFFLVSRQGVRLSQSFPIV